MNDELSNRTPGSRGDWFLVLWVLVFGARLLIGLSKQEPPPPDYEKTNKLVRSIVKSVDEADDTNYRSVHGGLKAAMRVLRQMQKHPDAFWYVTTFTVSPTDGRLVAHVKRDLATAPADKQEMVMKRIVAVWRGSVYVRRHGFSRAVNFVGPERRKLEWAEGEAWPLVKSGEVGRSGAGG